MNEVVRVLGRAVAVPLPAALVLWLAEVGGDSNDDGYGVFLGGAALSLGLVGLWACRDARLAGTARSVARWVTVSVLVGTTLGVLTTVLAPGSPRDEQVAEAVGVSVFFALPLLLGAGAGIGTALQRRRRQAKSR